MMVASKKKNQPIFQEPEKNNQIIKVINRANTGFAFNYLDVDELENQEKIELYNLEN